MATYASTVARNENICILTGEGIGGAAADLPKPEKEDCKDTKALADLSNPAKHLESDEVEASSLEQKSSQQGTKTTENAEKSNTSTDEEIERLLLLDELCGHNHAICIEMQKRRRYSLDGFDFESWDSSWNGAAKTFDEVTEYTKKLKSEIEIPRPQMETEILSPWPTVSPPTSDFDECSLDSPGVPLEDLEDQLGGHENRLWIVNVSDWKER